MPPKTRSKQTKTGRAPPESSLNKDIRSSLHPSSQLGNRRVTRSQTKKAALNELPIDSRRITRSQSKKFTQESSKKTPNISQTTQNLPEQRSRKHAVSEVLPSNPRQKPEAQVTQRLSLWLNNIEPALAEGVGPDSQADSNSEDESETTMQSSSSASGTSRIFSESASTVKVRIVPKHKILEKLRTRRAAPIRPTAEEKTNEFKSDFGVLQTISIPFKDTKHLQAVFRSFLHKAENAMDEEESYPAIEDVANDFNEWKSTVQLATVTNRDFKSDLKHCERSNEAVFQRTTLLSIIDRWRLTEMFDYNCEGQWTLRGKHFPLLSTQGRDDKFTEPKPDLAIFFNFESLIGNDPVSNSAPIPPDLELCIRPDKSYHRCFPFVFIEAKKGFEDITYALYANMHSASQALLNIYAWMERAGHQDAFFDHVRLFSIAINVEKFIVRVHRAIPLEGEDGLAYVFDELCSPSLYERDEICVLIRNILRKYGTTTLRGILKNTFDTVSRQYREEIQQLSETQKRKKDVVPGGRAKKTRTSHVPNRLTSQQPIDPSSSFGASGISLNDL